MFVDNIIYAGSTWYHIETFPNYPATEWGLLIYLKLDDNDAVTVTPTVSGSSFVINVDPAETAIDEGNYAYQYVFTNKTTGKVAVPYEGFVPIKALLTAAGDIRSNDEQVLEKLYAARLTISDRDYIEINIGGKSAKFKTLEEIDAKIYEIETKIGKHKPQRLLYRFE